MLDLKRIRTETDRVREAIALKKTKADLDRYLVMDEEQIGARLARRLLLDGARALLSPAESSH